MLVLSLFISTQFFLSTNFYLLIGQQWVPRKVKGQRLLIELSDVDEVFNSQPGSEEDERVNERQCYRPEVFQHEPRANTLIQLYPDLA